MIDEKSVVACVARVVSWCADIPDAATRSLMAELAENGNAEIVEKAGKPLMRFRADGKTIYLEKRWWD